MGDEKKSIDKEKNNSEYFAQHKFIIHFNIITMMLIYY